MDVDGATDFKKYSLACVSSYGPFKKYLVENLAKFMAQKYATENINIDYLTFVPIHEQKLKTSR